MGSTWVAQLVRHPTSTQVIISWSWVRVLHWALCCQHRACFGSSVPPSLPLLYSFSLSLALFLKNKIDTQNTEMSYVALSLVNKDLIRGAPGWLSCLGVRLQLRSWSRGLWVWTPHQALCWRFRAWSLLRVVCLPLSLPLPCLCSVCLSLSQK